MGGRAWLCLFLLERSVFFCRRKALAIPFYPDATTKPSKSDFLSARFRLKTEVFEDESAKKKDEKEVGIKGPNDERARKNE